MKRARYEYTYTSLENIPSCGFSQVHIYGVVKYATPIYMASRGTSYYTTVSLHNESLHNTKSRFTISIFADQAKELPACKVGQILRLNCVKLDKFNGFILGKVQMFYGGSWLLFDRESSTMHWDSSSQPHPCWQNSEADIVRKLKEWSITIDPDDPEATSKASNTEDKRDTSHICKQNDVTDLTANDSNGQRGQVVPTMTAHGATSAQHVTSTLRPATGVHGSITSVQQVALTLTQASGDHEPTTSVPQMTSALTQAAGDHEPTTSVPQMTSALTRAAGDHEPITSVPQITSALTHAAGDHEETKNAHQVATRVTRSAGTHKPIESVKQLTLTPVVDAPTNIRQMASALTQEAGDCKITTPVQDTISSTQAVSAKEPFISGHQITSKLTQGACARDLEQVSTTLAQVAGTHEAIATAYQVTPTFTQTIIKNQMVKSNGKQVLAGESPSGRNMVTGATVTYQNGCDKKHFRDRLKHQDRLKQCLLRENDIIYLFSPNAKDLAIIPEVAEVHHLDTRLLVAGLPYFSITEIHSIQSSGAHRHTPFLCRTSCDILPAFQCKQLSVGCCYKDLKRKDPDDMVICLSLSDTDDRSVVIPATVNQANLKSLCCGDDTRAGENNNGCQLLARIVPTIEIKDTQLSVRYVNRVDLILQIFGDVVNVCYSKTV